MEIDFGPPPFHRQSPYTVHIQELSSFDLDSYANLFTTSYTSPREKINRLLFIGATCPTLSVQAFTLAIQTIKSETLDVGLYQRTLRELQSAIRATTTTNDVETEDGEWILKTEKEAKNGIGKLEVDLKSYANNLIKESTRLTCRDLAMFQAKTGDTNLAIRTWLKSREFCTTNLHLLEMCMGVIELALEVGNYSIVKNYVGKAEAALESISALNSKPINSGASSKSSVTISDAYKLSVQHRLLIASSIAEMATGNFSKAARGFCRVKPPDLRTVLNDKGELQSGSAAGVAASSAVSGTGTGAAGGPGGATTTTTTPQGVPLNEFIVPPADIGLYAVICALATMSRTEVRNVLVDNNELRSILDSEPGLREIVREVGTGTAYGAAFRALGIGTGFKAKGNNVTTPPGLLEEHGFREGELTNLKARLELDIHLAGSNKLEMLRNLIRDKLVVRYFEPFEKLALERMGNKFGWSEEEIEEVVIDLIKRNLLPGRVDKREKILAARSQSSRKATFSHAIKMGRDAEIQTNSLLLRMKLLELEMFVGSNPSASTTTGEAGDASVSGTSQHVPQQQVQA